MNAKYDVTRCRREKHEAFRQNIRLSLPWNLSHLLIWLVTSVQADCRGIYRCVVPCGNILQLFRWYFLWSTWSWKYLGNTLISNLSWMYSQMVFKFLAIHFCNPNYRLKKIIPHHMEFEDILVTLIKWIRLTQQRLMFSDN